MIDENVIQRQGRIKREMLEQQQAVPFDLRSENLINRMSEKLLRDIDVQMLETNPVYKNYKVIPIEKFYKPPTDNKIDLTLTNGVFE